MASNDSKLDETYEDENVFPPSTQENEEIDVTWDWNSPRSKYNTNAVKKKRIRDTPTLQSPKLTMKRHHSNNQIPAFDKIKEEMAELRNRVIGSTSASNNKPLDVVFDDSVEQELVLCSQQVEAQIECLQKQNQVVSEGFADDSFDLVLEQLDDDKIEQLSQPVKKEELSKPVNSVLVEPVIVSDGEISPVKCSPEEIEQKRLQALEKLQAKKKQQIIEKNRLEALKRLERNKKKVSSLPRKLNVVIK